MERGQARVRLGARIDDEDRVTLPSRRHAAMARASDLGVAGDALVVQRMILSLQSDTRQQQVLAQRLSAVLDPASAQYGQWLSPAEFEQQFGVAPQDRQTVVAWLQKHGFTIDELPAGGRSIVFSGTVAAIRSAFRTDMHHYRVDGERHLANRSDPSIPDALSAVVSGVVSLHDFRSRPMRPPAKVLPEYTNGTSHALSPADFRTIYNLNPLATQGIDGTGRSIAILGRTDVVLADMQTFRSVMGLPAKDPVIIYNGGNPGRQSGDEGESDLDLQWAGAVAPGATIKFVTSPSTATTDGIDLSAQYAVGNNVADVISLSYGLCEADLGSSALAFYNGLWQQAAAQGQSVFVSSGDSGAADCDAGSTTTATRGRAVNGLCTSPHATCVGGTQFDDTANPATYWSASNGSNLGSALSYIPEVVWNESGTVSGGSGLWASGGGTSTTFTRPSWQTGNGVPSGSFRTVPDVSLTAASHDGYLVYSSDNATSTRTRYTFGGTSASAPSFAGLMALINQKTLTRQGNANPRFYQLAALQAGGGPAYFHRVISGNNSVPGVTGFAASTMGTTPVYNQATGWGSVDGDVLVNHWGDVLAATTTSLTASIPSSTYADPVSFTASVSGSAPTGSVQFQDGGVNLGAAVPLSNGSATLTTSTLATGSHSITAVYSGDGVNNSSTSAAQPFTVNPVISAVSLSLSSSTSTLGQSVTLTATLGGKSVSGSLRFMDGNVPLATVLIAACPTAHTTAALGAGAHNLSVQYLGDANNTASSSAVAVHTVALPATITTLSAAPASGAAGDTFVFTAQVSGQSPTGTVQFKDGNAALGSPVAVSGGSASFSTNQLGAGSHSITAVYSGDAANAGSTSTAFALTLGTATSSVTLSLGTSSATLGQSVALNVTVSGFAPTGTIDFLDGGTSLGSAPLVAGAVSFSTTALTVGSHTLTAVYSGDGNNAASTSAPVVVTVNAASGGTGDVPVLPWWGSGLLGAVLLALMARRPRRGLVSVAVMTLVLPLALLLPQSAWSGTLAGWDVHALPGGANAFGTSPLAATSADANLTVGGLTRGSGVGTSGTAAARGWGGTSWASSSVAAAVTANQFVTFSLTAQAGYTMSISSISRFDYRRSSSGATAGVLQVQVGAGAFTDLASLGYSSTASSGASLTAIDLTGVTALQAIPAGTVVTFRVVNYGASGGGGTWYVFDTANTTALDLEVTGTVVPAGPAVAGVCGSSAGKTFSTAPSSNLCRVGTPSVVNQGSSWNWTCSGSNGGTTPTCSAVDSSATGC